MLLIRLLLFLSKMNISKLYITRNIQINFNKKRNIVNNERNIAMQVFKEGHIMFCASNSFILPLDFVRISTSS